MIHWITYGYFANLFLTHQFGFNYVYQYSNLAMPKGLLMASSWAGQAGSLFLWSFFVCIILLVANQDKSWKKLILPILLANQLILILLIRNANPFEKTMFTFKDGLGMTPTLSNPLMIIHPPFAFLGYAFIALIFAYSIASLISHNYEEWIIIVKKYAYISLLSLSITIILGSLWAYQVLGWGGYWSFDPIENGTLITCLLLLSFTHLISLYQKQKTGLKLLYFLSIIIYASVIHMTLLIRSGILKNLTQHSYTGNGLLIPLFFADLIIFLCPIILLIVNAHKIKSQSLKNSIISSPGRLLLIAWVFIMMSGILFIDLNQPIISILFFFSPTKYSSFLRLMFVCTTIIGFIILFLRSSVFSHRRTIRIHTLGQLLIEFLVSCVVILFTLTSIHVGMSIFAILLFLLFLIPTLGAIKAIMTLRKTPWYSFGEQLCHLSICLLFISILLTSINNFADKICLEKNKPYQTYNYSVTLKDDSEIKSQYIGNKRSYNILFENRTNSFIVKPAIWTYQRNSGVEILKCPSIHTNKYADIMVIPQEKGVKTLLLNKETLIDDIIVTLKEYTKETNKAGFLIEKVTINFQKEVVIGDSEPSLQQEDYVLSRRITNQGIPLEKASVVPATYGDEIIWIKTERPNQITVSSNKISNTFEFDVIIKPFMLFFRFIYFSFLFSLLWIMIEVFFEKKIKKLIKKNKRRNDETRPHHAFDSHH